MPSSYSKYFHLAFIGKTCTDLVHPDTTCLKWLLRIFFREIPIGGLKFYFPICVSSLLFNIRKWNKKETWMNFLKMVTKCMIFSQGFGCSFCLWLCLEYHILRQYYMHLIVALPVFLGSFFSVFLPIPIQKAEAIGLFNVYLEYLIKSSEISCIQKFKKSLTTGTTIFAIFNAIIMCGMLKVRCPNFWFSKYKYSNDDKLASTCGKIHSNLTCSSYLFQELKQALKFTTGFCVVKSIIFSMKSATTNPFIILKTLIKNFDMKMFAFLTGIDGIFKFLFCYLNQHASFNTTTNCAISSFAAGLSYAFFPRYEIFTLAVTNVLGVLYRLLIQSYKDKEQEMPKSLKIIDKLPIHYILFTIITPTLVHLRMFEPRNVNKAVNQFITLGSNGNADMILYRGVNWFLGYK